MFEIICLGRMDFLMQVLNGLAMLTSDSGPAGYGGMVALGLLIGVLLALARAIVSQRLELQWVLVGWLLFSCLFVPKVTVTVEDIYTGTTNTVANVPLGPAAIGSVTSTVGVKLAEAFDAVFALPGFTNSGYMDSLEVINSMRYMDYGSANDGSVASAPVPNVDVRKTIREYLVRCVMQSMTMNVAGLGPTWSQLKEAPDLMAAIQVNTNILSTTVYLDASTPSGVPMGCFNAYGQISDYVSQTFFPAWRVYIGAQLGVVDPEARIQAALDSIFGIGHSAQNYMLNALFKREMELSELGFQASNGNDAGVLMRVQAMEQRRTQWAAEQSLWAEMARPAISFIEGFFYAASPFMGFMFCLGAPGISIFSRYLIFAIWIQLWMPILAICNLYISLAASSDLQRIGTSGTDLVSMTGLDSVWTETASWLAFGGNMVAATPLLSLVLITGSYFALTRLTDRLGGADHIDERVQSPPIMAPAALAESGALGLQTAAHTSDPIYGLYRTGLPSMLPSVNLSSDIRSNVQSARTAQEQAAQEWTVSLSSGLDLSHQKGREQFTSNLNTTGLSGAFSQTDAMIERLAKSATEAAGLSRNWYEDQRDQVTAALGVAMQQGQGMKGRASLDAALSNIRGISDSQRKDIGDRIEQLVGTNSDEMAQLSEKIQQDASEGVTSRFFQAMRVEDATRWAEAQRDSRSAAESFERADALSQSARLTQDIKLQAIGYQSSSQGWDADLLKLVSAHHLDMSQVEERAGFWSRTGAMDHDTALASAAALALADGPSSARLALAETLSQHGFGSPTLALDNERANEELMERSPAPESATRAVQTRVHAFPSSEGAAVRGDVMQQLSEPDLRTRGETAARNFFAAKRDGNAQKAQDALEQLDRVIEAQQAQHFESTFESERGFLKAFQDFDFAGTFGAVDVNVAALGEASRAAELAQAQVATAGAGYEASVVAGVAAGMRGYSKGFDEAVEHRRDRAFDEARSMGLPDAAATVYAEQSVFWHQSMDISVPRMLGKDEAFERVKAQAKEELGEKGYSMVSRAATAEPVAKKYYLDGAVSIYRHRQNAPQQVEHGTD